jgi:hypothetical protein
VDVPPQAVSISANTSKLKTVFFMSSSNITMAYIIRFFLPMDDFIYQTLMEIQN